MEQISIAFVGDIMPGGILHYSNKSCVEKDVLNYLNNYDLRIGTLECAFGDDLEFYMQFLTDQGKTKNIIYAKNQDVKRVNELNIDIVTIANNHIYDLGEKGLKNTIRILNENNIKYCGAGENLDEASKPAVTEINGKSIAFIGCAEILPSSPNPASKNAPGFNSLDADRIVDDIKSAKKLYDYVFILPHWGNEYTIKPTLKSRDIAFRFIDAGADGVFGGHPHTVQPNILYKNRPIFFSMGNFLFPNRIVHPPAPTYYPEKLGKINDYPASTSPWCNEITLKVWPKKAKIGLIAGLKIEKNIKITKKYVSFNNKLMLKYADLKLRYKIKLKVHGYMIKRNYEYFLKLLSLKKIFKTNL